MIATVVNSLAVIVGAIIGLIFRRLIKNEIWESVLKAIGIVVFVFGIIGVVKSMVFINEENILSSRFDLLLIVCIALGTFIGELLKIDHHLRTFGNYLEKKLNKGAFSEGFVAATLIYCVGAMAIVGSVNAALGDPSIIYLKATIDGITAIILASTLGYGVAFSSISVLLYQGILTLIAMFMGDFMSLEFVSAFSMVGYVIVSCIGFNFISKDKIKVANMTPSLILIIIYYLILK